MVLRSDERANQAEVERDQRLRGNIGKAVTTAGSLGAAGIAGGLASKVMPFLNEYIPAGLAMKGINKVSPKLGAFLQKGQDMGLDVQEGLNFLKDKLGVTKGNESPKQDRNIIQQYSPELHEFILEQINSGQSPLAAGALAELGKSGKSFKKEIEKIVKDHKAPWSSIIETVYGTQKNQSQPSVTNQPTPQNPQQGQPQGQGQGQAALISILQKIQQTRGK
jgi:hypothetical protein